ncbi:MAG: hypothetical protein WBK88_07085 [Methanothrix sp.]
MLSDLGFLENGQPWPPKDEEARLARTTANIDIYGGGRAAFTRMRLWLDKDLEAKDKKIHIKVDLPKKAADVVINGALPELIIGMPSSGEDETDARADDLAAWIDDERFYVTIEEVGIDWCRCGAGLAKISRTKDTVRVRSIRPDHWIPVCYPDDDRVYQHHVVWAEKTEGPDGSERTWLKMEIHSEDSIEYRLYKITESKKLERHDLSERPDWFGDYDLRGDVQQVPGWCIFPVWNSRSSDQDYGRPDAAFSDTGLSLAESIEMALSQRRYNHHCHSKPVTIVNSDIANRDPYTDREKVDLEKPILLQMDAGKASDAASFIAPPLDSSSLITEEVRDLLSMFVNVTGLSAAMISGVDSANVSSGRALMLELTPTMDHLRRFRAAFWAEIPAILEAASRLATPASGLPAITADDIELTWELSLATDPTETAARLEVLTRSKIISTQQALRELGYDAETIDRIIDELAEEARAGAVETPALPPLALGMGEEEEGGEEE